MAALGAELTLVRSVDGGMDETLTRRMIEAARQITERTGAFWTDQLASFKQHAERGRRRSPRARRPRKKGSR